MEILVRGSLETAKWVVRQGLKPQPGLGRQAFEVDGKFKFWGGLALHIWGGGQELLKALYANVERRGIPILYETPATDLIRENGRVAGVMAEYRSTPVPIRAGEYGGEIIKLPGMFAWQVFDAVSKRMAAGSASLVAVLRDARTAAKLAQTA